MADRTVAIITMGIIAQKRLLLGGNCGKAFGKKNRKR